MVTVASPAASVVAGIVCVPAFGSVTVNITDAPEIGPLARVNVVLSVTAVPTNALGGVAGVVRLVVTADTVTEPVFDSAAGGIAPAAFVKNAAALLKLACAVTTPASGNVTPTIAWPFALVLT